MLKIPQSDIGLSSIVVKEWTASDPATCPLLKGTSLRDDLAAQRLADSLRSRVDIREGYGGLELATDFFRGHIDVGPLRIAIHPKLPAITAHHTTTLCHMVCGMLELSMKPVPPQPTMGCMIF